MTAIQPGPASSDSSPARFRIVVEGMLDSGTKAWFDDAEIIITDTQTEFIVVAADQAALHGLLRRVHDLHLKLISVAPFDQQSTHTNE